jgi:hypothetical protein
VVTNEAEVESALYGCCSTAMLKVGVLPEAARPSRSVATPGMVAGVKVTVPSRAEVAVAVCVASSADADQVVAERGDARPALAGGHAVHAGSSGVRRGQISG